MKIFLMTLAAVGFILAGCSNDETAGYNVQDPNVINFLSSTTRATIATQSTLEGDPSGFKVYGTATDMPDAWYTNVDGANNYVCNSGDWAWATTPARWPLTSTSYPMYFYAMYPASMNVTATATSELLSNISITGAQQDLLAVKVQADAKPASGQLTLAFKHILSKIDFGVIAGHGMTVEVQKVAVVNVHRDNTFDHLLQKWGETTSNLGSYEYYFKLDLPFQAEGTENEDQAKPFFTDTPNHLMLMPQTSGTSGTTAPEAWDCTQGTLTSQTYIEVTYRIMQSSGDYIGYTNGANYLIDYPAYATTNPGWGSTYTSGLGTNGGTEYNDKLYIKVGFPLSLNWIPGKGYTYNICLGTADSTNGYYTDNTYYDKNGTDTNIPIVGPTGKDVEPGDPVTDGIINFRVIVDDWINSTANLN